MVLIEETAVPEAALPLDEFRAHLRMGTGFADDDLQDGVLENYLRAAISSIEARTGKILIERNFSWSLGEWRCAEGQALPVAPVKSLTRLVLRDRAEGEEEIDPGQYWLDADTQRPAIRPADGVLPAIHLGGVAEISFTAGFADEWAELPSDLGQAVLLLAAHYYENRHETVSESTGMPFGVSSARCKVDAACSFCPAQA